jgi:hypothetical protein
MTKNWKFLHPTPESFTVPLDALKFGSTSTHKYKIKQNKAPLIANQVRVRRMMMSTKSPGNLYLLHSLKRMKQINVAPQNVKSAVKLKKKKKRLGNSMQCIYI